ncbi:MAG TPA: hypothetical protein PLV68_05435, partial [Ilumatobacteraceae bacterium]|nr:hypothetical protein [Ilumatobacteraceae bacterium]
PGVSVRRVVVPLQKGLVVRGAPPAGLGTVPARSTLAIVDAWLAEARAELGNGWALIQLEHAAPRLVCSLGTAAMHRELIEFGFAGAAAGQSLELTLHSVRLLAAVVEPSTARLVDTREVAVMVSEGWNAAELARLQVANDLIPMPTFLHLLTQRCISRSGDADIGPETNDVALVVIDVQAIEIDKVDLARMSESFVTAIRSVWGASQLLAQGANANLVTMIDRDARLHGRTRELRRLIAGVQVPGDRRVHVWVEPLAVSVIHVRPHLESLVGPIDAGPSLPVP